MPESPASLTFALDSHVRLESSGFGVGRTKQTDESDDIHPDQSIKVGRAFATNDGPSGAADPAESISMSRGFPQILGRSLCLLTVFALLAATPGCGDDSKKDESAGGITPGAKEANDNMENFMNSQKKKK